MVYVHIHAENRPQYVYLKEETAIAGFDFFIYVPETLSFNKNEMNALVNFYKLLGKRFSIIKY
jgi:hypothetical protein